MVIPVFKVIVSPKYNQVINGNVIIDVENPINLTAHKFPNPSYPILVAYQKNKLIGIAIKAENHIALEVLAHSHTS